MKLIVAEKPSVAADIARVLNVKGKKHGCFENDQYIVTWCIGHLVGLANPDDYDERYKRWVYEDLPIVPENWKFVLNPQTKKQYDVVKSLMNDKRVDGVICATDAGREGELIFRYVYQTAKCKKPAYRLWTSSLEDAALREGLKNVKDIAEYDNLYYSGHCRSKADWLVGMNLSRLYTLVYQPEKPYAVGRVMTPTLNMIVQRHKEHVNFIPEEYFQVQLDFGSFTATSERFQSLETADAIFHRCFEEKKAEVTKVEKAQKNEGAPKLYDLTALQRDCNKIFGYSAKQTLEYAQGLYERKFLTYPRTDSRYLTEDMFGVAADTAQAVQGCFGKMGIDAPVELDNISNILNSAKVSDHHAIMPTMTLLNSGFDSLTQAEKNIVQLVSARLLCAIGDKHIYESTAVNLLCADTEFQSKGKVVIQTGWKGVQDSWNAFLGRKKESDTEEVLPNMAEGTVLMVQAGGVKKGVTQPPKLYREDTLLSAMERAGNDSLDNPNEVERKGLGTPATRADTIEKLISTGYVERNSKKDLLPTERGINAVKVFAPELLDAKLTAEWENKLSQIAKGKMSHTAFMAEINGFIQRIIFGYKDEYAKVKATLRPSEKLLGKCPFCGSDVVEDQSKMNCKGCKFAIFKNNRFFSAWGIPVNAEMVTALITKRRAEVVGKSSKSKKNYNAVITMGDLDNKTGYTSFNVQRA